MKFTMSLVALTSLASISFATRAATQRLVVPAFYGINSDWSRIQAAGSGIQIVVADGSFKTLAGAGLIAAQAQFGACHAAGQLVLGYVDTKTASRPIQDYADGGTTSTSIMDDVMQWYSSFPSQIDGIFFDDGPYFAPNGTLSDSDFHTYYTTLYGDVKTFRPAAVVMLNASQYYYEWVMSAADYVLVFENSFSNYVNEYVALDVNGTKPPPSWWSNPIYSGRISHVIYGAAATNLADIRALSQSRGSPSMYVHDQPTANYSALPSFFEQEVGYLADYPTRSWTIAAAMITPRAGHTATLLPSGKVLVTGGETYASPYCSLASAEIYDPATATWTSTAPMTYGRSGHSAVLLANGLVLVSGGNNLCAGYYGPYYEIPQPELYNPATGSWASTGSASSHGYPYGGHTIRLLPSGKVLLVKDGSSSVYDPSTGTWNNTGLGTVNSQEGSTLLLPSGKVLMAGGSEPGTYGRYATSDAQLYDPTANTWTATVPLPSLPNSSLVLSLVPATGNAIGLLTNTYKSGVWTLGGSLFDPIASIWSETGACPNTNDFTLVILASGEQLVTGGDLTGNGNSSIASTQLYSPWANTWAPSGIMNSSRVFHTATLLASGKILVAGGVNSTGALQSAEVYW